MERLLPSRCVLDSLSGCDTNFRPISTRFSIKLIWQLSVGDVAVESSGLCSLSAILSSRDELELCRDIEHSRSMMAWRSFAARWRRFVDIVSSTDPRSKAQLRAKSVFSLHLNYYYYYYHYNYYYYYYLLTK